MLRCELQEGWAPPQTPPRQVDPGFLQRTHIPGLSQGKIPASMEGMDENGIKSRGQSRTMALLEPGRELWDQECHSLGAAHGYPGPAGTLGHLPHPEELGDTAVVLFSPNLLLGKHSSGMLCVNSSDLAGALWGGMGSGVPGISGTMGPGCPSKEKAGMGQPLQELAAPRIQISLICANAGSLEERKQKIRMG